MVFARPYSYLIIIFAALSLARCGAAEKKSREVPLPVPAVAADEVEPTPEDATREAPAETKEPDVKPLPKAHPPKRLSPIAKLRATAEAQGEANHYKVRLDWTDENGEGEAWQLFRERDAEDAKHLGTFNRQIVQFIDDKVQAGRSYRYALYRMVDSTPVLMQKQTIEVPRDLVVKGIQRLTTTFRVQRIFFTEGARAYTNGSHFKIDVDEIISADGIIETFPEKTKAGRELDGRAGGDLWIRARRGSGKLSVLLRGEDGGDGVEGGGPGIDGKPGLPGNPGESIFFPAFIRDPNEHPSRHARVLNPTNGREGERGAHADAGTPGGRGGATGTLHVLIDDPTDFRVEPSLLVGAGGKGGLAGAPGKGGPGGPPGALDPQQVCYPAAAGPEGHRGAKCAKAADGPPGISQFYCLRLGGTRLGDCSAERTFPPMTANAVIKEKL